MGQAADDLVGWARRKKKDDDMADDVYVRGLPDKKLEQQVNERAHDQHISSTENAKNAQDRYLRAKAELLRRRGDDH